MHCRKLHRDEKARKKLHEALKALYADGVRVPQGKPYELRKARAKAIEAERQVADAIGTDGLELVDDDKVDLAAGRDPYRCG